MPDIDKAWAAIRELMPKFLKVADKYNKVRLTPFAQALYFLGRKIDSSGLCFGLSVLYLLSLKRGHDPIAMALMAAAQPDAEESKQLNNIVTSYHNEQANYRSNEQEDRVRYFKDAFWEEGLREEERQVFAQEKLTAAAEYMASKRDTYFLITSPNHAMACVTINSVYMFFDPNFGEICFGNSNDFTGFFAKWMSNERIVKTYKGTEGGLITAGPAKSLVLKIWRFSVR